MANSILSSLVNQSSFKLYSSAGISVLPGVKVMRVSAHLSARLMKNIGEDGRAIIDTKIILPITVTITCMAATSDAVDKINNLIQDINGVYRLYSRGLYFERLTLASETYKQSAQVMSATPTTLTFNGIMRQNDTTPVTAQAGDADTIIGGIVNTVESTVSDTAAKLSSIASSLF